MQPTTLCNLDCRYCYLPFRHTEHLMSGTVAEAVATTVNRWAADRPGFEVVWHGGEPLAAGRTHLRRLMDPFDDVIHTVQTNATLIDDAWCRFFREHDMRVGISIDGPESMNVDRVSRSGATAFLRVHRGIDKLREHGIPFSAISVVTDPTPHAAEALYECLAHLGCTVAGVNIEEQEGVNLRAANRDPAAVVAFWATLTALWDADRRVRIREIDRVLTFAGAVLDGALPDGSNRVDPLPTVAFDGSVVLVSPELAGFEDPRFGTLSTGNVTETPLDVLLDQAATRTPWLPEFLVGVAACRDTCPYFAFCGGGHPANKYFEHAGRMDGTQTRYCTASKIALIEGVIQHAHHR